MMRFLGCAYQRCVLCSQQYVYTLISLSAGRCAVSPFSCVAWQTARSSPLLVAGTVHINKPHNSKNSAEVVVHRPPRHGKCIIKHTYTRKGASSSQDTFVRTKSANTSLSIRRQFPCTITCFCLKSRLTECSMGNFALPLRSPNMRIMHFRRKFKTRQRLAQMRL